MNSMLGRIVSLSLCAVLVLGSVSPARAGLGEDAAKRLITNPGDFPLFPAIGSLISVASVPFLYEGAKGIAGAGLLGVPLGMGMALLGQTMFGEKPDYTKAFVSGLGSTLAALPFAMMAGPAAPLVLFGASMGGSFLATWALDAWRARQKQQPVADSRRVAGGPAGGSVPQGGMSLLGVGGN
jgi:hypothetical protein